MCIHTLPKDCCVSRCAKGSRFLPKASRPSSRTLMAAGTSILLSSAGNSSAEASDRMSRCSSDMAAYAAASWARRIARRLPMSSRRCARLVRRGMQEGAFGLSSGLFYTPGSFATTEEVIALTTAAAGDSGGLYTSHIRDEADYGDRRRGGGGRSDSHRRRGRRDRHRDAYEGARARQLGPGARSLTKRIDDARARGVQVFADQYAVRGLVDHRCAPRCCRAAFLFRQKRTGPCAAEIRAGRA